MKKSNNHVLNYFANIGKLADKINKKQIEILAKILKKIRKKKGKIFFLGVGGSAGNCSHAVNDFRKICEIDCYAPTDNVSELTARINDDGWESAFANWLAVSNINSKDAIFIMSVGGGNKEKNVSVNLIKAIQFAKKYNIDLKKSFMVGDRLIDIVAGRKAKCRSIFLDKKYF